MRHVALGLEPGSRFMPKTQDFLVNQLGLSLEDSVKIEEQSRKERITLMHAVENSGKADVAKVLEAFAEFFKVPKVDLTDKEVDKSIIELIPSDLATKYRMIPLEKAGNNVVIAIGNPTNLDAIDAVKFKCGLIAKTVLGSETKISELIDKYYGKMDLSKLAGDKSADSGGSSEDTKDRIVIGAGSSKKDDGPIVSIVNDVLIQCLETGASDIHFESYEDFLRIRLRIDGSLVEIARPPANLRAALISRIKIMSALNIAETRLPQDGAINLLIGDKPTSLESILYPLPMARRL